MGRGRLETSMGTAIRRSAAAGLVAATAMLAGCVAINDSGPDGALVSEVQELRARESIRELLHAYGRTLDARDFDGFGRLWAEDAEYVGGPGGQAVTGPQAIADFLEGIFAANPSGLEGPTAHIFFNEEIDVNGDTASGASLGAFVSQGEAGAQMVILAAYDDRYVREGGVWKFSRRVVRGLIPAPQGS